VICVRPSALFHANLLDKLRSKHLAVLQCSEDVPIKSPEVVTRFITQNNLECLLVVSNLSKSLVTEALRYSTEKARLGRLAVSYLDIRLLGRERTGSAEDNIVSLVVLTNAARLEHADLIRDAVPKTILGAAKVSRRDLLRAVPRVLRIESNIPIAFQNQCDHRSATCIYCKDACPVGAISLFDNRVVIDDRLCCECGACARECPIGAIQGPSVSDQQILAMLNAVCSEKANLSKCLLLLSCPLGLEKLAGEMGEAAGLDLRVISVPIPCVAAVGSVHYLWAVCLGVSLLTVCPDISCKNAEAAVRLYRHVASSRNLLRTSPENEHACVNHLSLNSNESVLDCVSQTIGSISSSRWSAELTGQTRREVFHGAIRQLATLGNDGSVRLPQDNTLPLFDVEVDGERCTYCEICLKKCPDHAIEISKSEDAVIFVFDPAACGGCLICEKICPVQAIHVSKLVQLSGVLESRKEEKARDRMIKCEGCDTILGTRGSLRLLRKELQEQGSSDAMLRTLSFCNRCKSKTYFRPVVKPLPVSKDVAV
jgi:Fe-S-cluster-containing hydrogenase component 2